MVPAKIKTPPKIEFGIGAINNLPEYVRSFGTNILILSGASSLEISGKKEYAHSLLDPVSTNMWWETIADEPTPSMVDTIVGNYSDKAISVVISLGGGSVLDAGKAVSAMLALSRPVTTFLEGVGSRTPTGEKIPFIAIPTTAGTGSEATSNAVITKSGIDGFKKSLRHDNYIPDVALIDPLLMVSCPPDLTASCGMDTFTQLVEAYLSRKSSEHTNAIALQGIESVHQGLFHAVTNGDDLSARSQMAFGSLCSGIVLLNAGLGLVHGIAPILGARFSVPHGVACGSLMASSNDVTLKKLQTENGDHTTRAKYSKLGRLVSKVSGKSDAWYQDRFIAYLYELTNTLKIPRLSQLGITGDDIEKIATAASNKYNPVSLTSIEIEQVLTRRL